jgi:hypothetical protein
VEMILLWNSYLTTIDKTTEVFFTKKKKKLLHAYLGIFTLAHRSICFHYVNLHFEVSKILK